MPPAADGVPDTSQGDLVDGRPLAKILLQKLRILVPSRDRCAGSPLGHGDHNETSEYATAFMAFTDDDEEHSA
ncbi:hypothetical protein JYU29_08425 [Tianweitania sp. BSSL-BM11]|uniref:Uncharacterized protein n=1 Tax=Tianweitania aestuarii TaxID=2814886 RepID=A0ABS5RUN0_9HYPH|nr:hypothetical protein [Tianweitania aestuarii]MBS9720709.1 hypothetical protein [Tianweitania aestuarii]